MKHIKLKPLSEQPLYGQFFYIFGENYNWNQHRLVITNTTVTDSETGQVYLLATPEEEELFKVILAKKEVDERERQLHFYDDKTGPFIDLWNTERWRSGLDHLNNNIKEAVEMSEESYWHFLECVPPKRMVSKAFVCGEPYTHNNKGEGIYLCGIQSGDRFFAQYGTIREFDAKELFKNLPL